MNRYIIKEQISYCGYNQWTVFAESTAEAKELVKQDSLYSGKSLSEVSQRPAAGRKYAGIHKSTSDFNQ